MKVSCSLLILLPSLASASKFLVDYLKEYEGETVSIASGNVTNTSAVVWARCNSEQDSVVSVTYSPIGRKVSRGGAKEETTLKTYARGDTDYTAKFELMPLSPNTHYEYRFECATYNNTWRVVDCSSRGSFWTAPALKEKARVSLVWTADLAGQGWGQNPHLEVKHTDGSLITGGYVMFETMRKVQPDFAIFQGDMIYADNAIPKALTVPAEVGGGTWKNEPFKNFIAQTVDEFRANWKYNYCDKHFQKFLEEVPIYTQWDDHEVTNNWYPDEILDAAPYNGLPAAFLAARAKQALFEFNPIVTRDDLIYRNYLHGSNLEVFLLDERSYRGPNSRNVNPRGIDMLGREQLDWLKASLKNSMAKFKVISTHDPITIVTGGENDRDSFGQGNARALGRELEIKELLSFIKAESIKNVLFLASDVHFSAAILADPERANFTDFNPFYEFVIGPAHAGTFGAVELDPTFGPSYEFLSAPSNSELELNPETPPLPQNSPPPNLQSFGHLVVDEEYKLTIQFIDVYGEVIYERIVEHW